MSGPVVSAAMSTWRNAEVVASAARQVLKATEKRAAEAWEALVKESRLKSPAADNDLSCAQHGLPVDGTVLCPRSDPEVVELKAEVARLRDERDANRVIIAALNAEVARLHDEIVRTPSQHQQWKRDLKYPCEKR